MDLDREALKRACILFGGLRATANRAGVSPGNLSQWFKGVNTLSAEKVARVLNVMGLPNGEPDETFVHDWQVRLQFFEAPQELFPLYFPNGAEMAVTPWPKIGLENIFRRLSPGPEDLETVHFLFDGKTRAVCRTVVGTVFRTFDTKGFLKYRGGKKKNAIINPSLGENVWAGETPTIAQFDALWSSSLEDKKDGPQSWDQVIQEAQELGWTHEGLLKKIRTEEPE